MAAGSVTFIIFWMLVWLVVMLFVAAVLLLAVLVLLLFYTGRDLLQVVVRTGSKG